MQQVRTAATHGERSDLAVGAPVITFGICCCAWAIVLVLAVALVAA